MELRTRLPRPARYFFALLPDPAAAAASSRRAHALRQWLGLSGRSYEIRKYHVSLWGWPFRAEPDAQELALMRRAARDIRQRPFRLRLDEAACFAPKAEKPALVLTGDDGVIGADRLSDALDQDMRTRGIRRRRPPGRPHLTLHYDRFQSDAFRVRPLSWLVTDFALVRSQDGEPYRILGRWPLIGA